MEALYQCAKNKEWTQNEYVSLTSFNVKKYQPLADGENF